MDKLIINRSLFKAAERLLGSAISQNYSTLKVEPFMRRDVRRKDVLATNPNQTKYLRDGADYTYLDGRPTPYGSRQVQRIEKQMEYTGKIIKLTREVDGAKALYKSKQLARDEERQGIINSKLKQKGKNYMET